MALSNAPNKPNVNENWLFNFTADNSNCLEFDGTDDYVSFGDVLGLYRNVTLEAWIKPDSYSGSSGTQIIVERANDGSTIAKNTNWQLALRHNGIRFKYQYGTGSNVANTVSTSAITVNNWHHVAVQRDDTDEEMRFYVDGVKISTVTTDVENAPEGGGDGIVSIGANFEQGGDFDGEIAHVRVWNYVRTEQQIATYYNRLVDSSELGLVGYWKLNEGNGTTVSDFSSNNNSGTINNASWSINGFDQHIYAFNLSFKNTIVDNIKYDGCVINKSMVIRDSIDITRGTSSTNNITIKCSNILYRGSNLYKLLFSGTNNYLNKSVRVYAQYEYASALSSCQRIFTGRIVDIKVDQNQVITFQVNSQRPWDKIEFPRNKHTNKNIYEPVVYGAYNYSNHVDASYGGLFPVPLIATEDLKIKTLMPRSYSSGDNNYLHFYVGQDYFLPMASASVDGGTEAEATAVEFGVNVLSTPVNYYAKGYIVPKHGSDMFERTELNDGSKAFIKNTTGDIDTDYFAYYDHPDSSTGAHRYLQIATVPKISASTKIRKVKLRHGVVHTDGSGSGQFYQVDFFKDGSTLSGNLIYDNSTDGTTGTVIGTGSTGSDAEFLLQTAAEAPTELNLDYTNDTAPPNYVSEQHQLKLFGVKIFISIRFWKPFSGDTRIYGENSSGSAVQIDDTSNNAENYENINRIKYFYCGGPGLTESWTGGNTAIAWGIEAFRDLMIRFAGNGTAAPTGYSDLYYDRRTNTSGTDLPNWKIRYWQLEPVPLKNALDKIAYEFGFVYKFSADSTLKLIHVINTSEYTTKRNAGEILNVTGYDLANINVSTTSLNDLVTKMTIANNKHPAPESNSENVVETSGRKAGYYNFTTSTNTSVREKYNFGEKQNIANVNLDMNIGTIPSTPNADCNDDFYSYYNNIIGDFKIIVECDVINMAKGAQLETGDVITFTDMPVDPFAGDFNTNNYFMIVETKRSVGKISITAREVG